MDIVQLVLKLSWGFNSLNLISDNTYELIKIIFFLYGTRMHNKPTEVQQMEWRIIYLSSVMLSD